MSCRLAFDLTKNQQKLIIKLVRLPRVISKYSAVAFVKGNGVFCSGCVCVSFFVPILMVNKLELLRNATNTYEAPPGTTQHPVQHSTSKHSCVIGAVGIGKNVHTFQQDTQSVLMIEFYSSHMLARHVSDLTGPSSGAFFTSCMCRFGMW